MKLLITTLIILITPHVVNASYYDITCSTANSSISNVTGHRHKTTVQYYDMNKNEIVSKEIEAYLEVEERIADVANETRNGECSGSQKITYLVKAKLKADEPVSKAVQEAIKAASPYFLCVEHSTWMHVCE